MSGDDGVMWRDGELIPFADATIHVLSHAAHRGSEVFDVLRIVYNDDEPAALGLRPHVARFDRSMQLMGMETPYELKTVEEAVADTVAANPGARIVKLVAAWADVAMATVPTSRRPSVLVAALPAEVDDSVLSPSARIQTAPMPKLPASILPPSLKVAASYTAGLRQQLAVRNGDVDDVIFRTMEGRLAEATTQALLVVRGHHILAPTFDTVLDSITRRLLFDLAPAQDLTVGIRDVHWDEVTSADELILTSTTHLVRPIGRLDDRTLEAPGPIARQLAADVEALIAGHHELSDRWLTPLS